MIRTHAVMGMEFHAALFLKLDHEIHAWLSSILHEVFTFEETG
jgi:hypothetical protein